MKRNYDRLNTRFGREVRFNVEPLPFRATETTELEQLKDRLLRKLLQEVTDEAQNTRLRRAANEAAALAWLTRYPLLTFPTLLQEKADTAKIQRERQARIRQRSENILLKAA